MKPFLFGQLFHEALEYDSSRIGFGINRMADTINKSCMIKSISAQQAFQITGYLFFIGPVVHILFHVLKHLHNLDVGTAVTGTLKRTDGSSHYGVSVCQGGCNYMSGKGGVVSAAVLHMKNHADIKNSGFQWSIRAVGAKNVQNVFRHGTFRHGLMDEKAVAVVIMAVSLITIDG